MRLIGITGGVGAGKTEILAYIRKHYRCEIYLADQVAHAVQEPGGACFERLVALLGQGILGEDGRLDRAALASRIFIDKQILEKVNAIVHPAVREYLLEKVRRAKEDPGIELFFIEAALLVETGYKEIVDELWYIHAGEAVRVRRLQENRGYTPEKAASIMSRQLSEEAFREACDFVIDNSGTLEDSFRQIDRKLEAFTWRD